MTVNNIRRGETMDFELSHEEVMLADSVDAFGARHFPSAARLKVLDAGRDVARARWMEMAELGWLGLGLSDNAAHSAVNDSYIVTIAEGFGRHLMLEPFVTRCVLAPALIVGSEGIATSLLAGIADGSVALALALGEPDAGFAIDHVQTNATVSRNGFRLSGVKNHVLDGADAEWFAVPARTAGSVDDPNGISLFLVYNDAPGLTVERHLSIDGHRHARLIFDEVSVADDARVGPLGTALPRLANAIDRAIVAHLAEALGSMEAVAKLTLDYLKTRVQFGKPIGTFQTLQHRMVDINTACEEARSMVYLATASLSTEPAQRAAVIAAAKARVGQCGLFAARQAVQLHGGLGFSAELIVSHHLKRQMMLDLAYGNADYQKRRFAEITRHAA